ncbi:ribosomal RNA small subunit methyltransferase I [Deltaproteobacteria bacterium]|nr:ribosomal RNA small subunit methyltransferase I [Deltaproteobacteria bacterium]
MREGGGPGRLSVVAVPIGNAEDITLRALRVLREADVVAAEDTRTTSALLAHHGQTARLLSYHDHSEADRLPALLARIAAGEHVALVSEAGTPLVNDPGFRLVRACVEAGLQVDVLPGASAPMAALVGAGLPVDRFFYGGFFPRDAGPRTALADELGGLRATLVFFESPQRLGATLDWLASNWAERQVVVARNITRKHEQWLRGTAAEVRLLLGDEDRGEVVLLLGPPPERPLAEDPDALAATLLASGMDARAARDALAEATGLSKRDAYRKILDRLGK